MRTQILAPSQWREELEDYGRWLRSAGLSDSTVKLRSYQMRSFAVAVGMAPYEVGFDHLTAFLSEHDWKPATRRARQASLRSFYTWATVSGRIGLNPTQSLPSVKVPLGRPRPASEDAITAGFDQADARVKLMIKLGSRLGLRCCEIAQVSTDHLTQTARGWTLRVVGKGGKVRMLPVVDVLAHEILEQPPGYLFPGRIDGHLSSAYVSKLVSWALPEGVTAHPLRHRFATKAYRGSGWNLRAVQELLGHSSVATTQIYTAVDDDDLRTAATFAA
jgi:integrase